MEPRRPSLRVLRKLLAILLAIAWVTAATMSHLPAAYPIPVHASDKTLHAVGFFALSALFWLTLLAYGSSARRRVALVALVMPLYAAIDELTQPFFRRSADVLDWVADCVGVAAALATMELLLLVISSLRRRQSAR